MNIPVRFLKVLSVVFLGSFLLLLSTYSSSEAASCVWQTTVGGYWSNGSNWDCDGTPRVPADADDVYIIADGDYPVMLDITTTVNSLYVGGSSGTQTLSIFDASLTVNGDCIFFPAGTLNLMDTGTLSFNGVGDVILNGEISITGVGSSFVYNDRNVTLPRLTLGNYDHSVSASIVGSGTLTVTERFEWFWGGTMTGNGNLVIADTATAYITGGIIDSILNNYTFTNNGSLLWEGSYIVVNGKSLFENYGTFILNQDGGYNINQTSGSGSLNNYGIMTKSGNATMTIDTALNNQGTFIVQAGSLAFNAPFGNNDGLIDVQGGTLTFNSGGYTSPLSTTIVSGASGKISFNYQSYTLDGSLSGSNVTFFNDLSAPIDINGDFNMTGTVEKYDEGTLNFNGTVSGAGETFKLSAGIVDFKALDIVIPNLIIEGVTSNIIGSGSINVTSSFSGTGGGFTGVAGYPGMMVMTSEATSTTSGTLGFTDWTIQNEGIFIWNYTLNMSPVSSIFNYGLFDATGDGSIFPIGSGTRSFANYGTLRKSGGVGTSSVVIPFTNYGTITISSGTLAFWQGSYTNTLTNTSSGTINGTGTLDIANSTFTTSGAITPATQGTAGTLTIKGKLPQTSTSSINIDIGGTIAGSQHDVLAVSFTGAVGSGVLTLAGALNVSLINGFVPAIGDSFTIITYFSKSGSAFSSVNWPTLPSGRGWRIQYNSTNITLSVVNTDPNISVSPASPFSYGNVPTGTPTAQTFTISNTGLTGIASALVISGISLTGDADFTVNTSGGGSPCGTLPRSVAAGSNCTITVTLNPSSTGAKSTTLTIVSNDPDTPNSILYLGGTGVIPTYTLSITKTGTGTGTVTSDIGGINCGSTCSATYTSGDVVILSASPNSGFVFIGWAGGGCSGSGTCTVTMSSAQSVTATFSDPNILLNEFFSSGSLPSGWTVVDNAGTAKTWKFNNPGGRSNLTGGSTGFAIADSWNAGNYAMDTELRSPSFDMSSRSPVTLEFKTDFYYYAWGQPEKADVDVSTDGGTTWTNVWRKTADYRGARTETLDLTSIAAGQSNVKIRFHYYSAYNENWWEIDDVKITAPPVVLSLSVTKNGTGSGTVSSDVGGINCGSTCSVIYNQDDEVTLFAVPDAGFEFAGWSGGGCSGTGSCVITMNGAKAVTASFMNPVLYMDESFSSGLPIGWSVKDNAGTAKVWTFNDPGGRGNLTGGTGSFAIADSYNAGYSNMDTELRSPSFNFASKNGVVLEFKTDFFYYSGGSAEKADVDVSTDNGASWSNVWSKSGADYRGPRTETVDISSIAAGRSNVAIRFHYYNAYYDNWWQVDDVKIHTQTVVIQKFDLAVMKAGTGSGTVSSVPSGISCGSTCTASFDEGTPVTLSATADTGSVFSGWSGACSGTGTCDVTLSEAKSVTAEFTNLWTDIDQLTRQACITNSASLDAALSEAGNDGKHNRIRVIQGTYVGLFGYDAQEDFDLVIEGGWNAGCTTRTHSPEGTILDGDLDANGTGDGVTLDLVTTKPDGTGSITVDGLHVKNGYNGVDDGGCVRVSTITGTATVTGNITEHCAAVDGAGIGVETGQGAIRISENMVYANTASGNGGGISVTNYSGTAVVLNNTITANTATVQGGGLSVWLMMDNATADIQNNIIRGNTAGQCSDVYIDSDGDNNDVFSTVVANYNDLGLTSVCTTDPGFTLGANNVDVDPLFVDAANGDYHLSVGSTLINAGNKAHTGLSPMDIDGQSRILWPSVDIGADEVVTVQVVTLTASKPNPLGLGEGVTLTATASGGSGSYDYKFWVLNPVTGKWEIVQDYGHGNTLVWSSAQAGTYTFTVYARNLGSNAGYEAIQRITVTVSPLTVTLTWDRQPSNRMNAGEGITFSASVNGMGTYDYKFYVKDRATGIWTMMQDYGNGNNWFWMPPAGEYNVIVYAKQQGSALSYQAVSSMALHVY